MEAICVIRFHKYLSCLCIADIHNITDIYPFEMCPMFRSLLLSLIHIFNFEVPTELPGVDPAILDPRDTYADASEWEVKAKDLAAKFVKNFAKYEGNEAGKALVAAGPQA